MACASANMAQERRMNNPASVRGTQGGAGARFSPACTLPEPTRSRCNTPVLPHPLPPSEEAAYNWQFWMAYVANAALVAANSLLFRYVEFVRLYEPLDTRLWLGIIVGVGMVGSLLMRLVQGSAIDHYGARRMWLASTMIFVVACLSHLMLHSVREPWVFVLRVMFNVALAGAFGSSMVYISRRASPERMAELIGTLGTSGFIGMIVGPVSCDLLFNNALSPAYNVQRMFLLASALGMVAMLFAALATHSSQPPAIHHRRPPLGWLLKRYYPGAILWVGVAVGMGLAITQSFLADFAADRGITSIAVFYNSFAITAFITRLSIRSFPQKYGFRPMLLLGSAGQVISFLLLLVVYSKWMFLFPGMVAGFAHAFFFPGVVAGGGTAFPARYRGIGTTLMMGTFDLGILLGAPSTGALLFVFRHWGWPPYPLTLLCINGVLAAVGLYYYFQPPQHITRYRPMSEKMP